VLHTVQFGITCIAVAVTALMGTQLLCRTWPTSAAKCRRKMRIFSARVWSPWLVLTLFCVVFSVHVLLVTSWHGTTALPHNFSLSENFSYCLKIMFRKCRSWGFKSFVLTEIFGA